MVDAAALQLQQRLRAIQCVMQLLSYGSHGSQQVRTQFSLANVIIVVKNTHNQTDS